MNTVSFIFVYSLRHGTALFLLYVNIRPSQKNLIKASVFLVGCSLHLYQRSSVPFICVVIKFVINFEISMNLVVLTGILNLIA